MLCERIKCVPANHWLDTNEDHKHTYTHLLYQAKKLSLVTDKSHNCMTMNIFIFQNVLFIMVSFGQL